MGGGGEQGKGSEAIFGKQEHTCTPVGMELQKIAETSFVTFHQRQQERTNYLRPDLRLDLRDEEEPE